MAWWRRSKQAPAHPMMVALAGYPPFLLPHPGDMALLSEPERDANLEAFLMLRADRLAIVVEFLAGLGIDARPMLDPRNEGVAAARAVDDWLSQVVPKRTMTILGDPEPNPDEAGFRASDRSGPDIRYSLIADLALLEGEAIRLRDSRFAWAINRLPGFEDMPDYHRICLIMPGKPGWAPVSLDIAEHLVVILHHKGAPSIRTDHYFGELLDGSNRGGFDES